jgi:[ribosomal protein S5]-alanine N-acetyltransferase
MEITSGDIKLRTFRLSDAPRLVELCNNENIARNLRDGFPNPYRHKDAEFFIQKYKDLDPPSVFAIEYLGVHVGNISLVKGIDVYSKSAEVGYFLGEEFWNKGIATKALTLICDYGFKNLDIVRIHTGVFSYNPASQRVLEKCGFIREGVFKNAIFKRGRFLDEVRFAKLNIFNP